eukprot:Sspe_Gene.56613::Locus_31130_Transcript_1_1_Confidence_1.000_Length_1143::g.56613::m.56613
MATEEEWKIACHPCSRLSMAACASRPALRYACRAWSRGMLQASATSLIAEWSCSARYSSTSSSSSSTPHPVPPPSCSSSSATPSSSELKCGMPCIRISITSASLPAASGQSDVTSATIRRRSDKVRASRIRCCSPPNWERALTSSSRAVGPQKSSPRTAPRASSSSATSTSSASSGCRGLSCVSHTGRPFRRMSRKARWLRWMRSRALGECCRRVARRLGRLTVRSRTRRRRASNPGQSCKHLSRGVCPAVTSWRTASSRSSSSGDGAGQAPPTSSSGCAGTSSSATSFRHPTTINSSPSSTP